MPYNLYIASNNTFELRELTNTASGEVVTDAAVQVTVYERNGDQVAGQLWPVTMTHVSSGDYRGTLESTIELVENQQYSAHIVANTVDGNQMTWRVGVSADYAGWGC